MSLASRLIRTACCAVATGARLASNTIARDEVAERIDGTALAGAANMIIAVEGLKKAGRNLTRASVLRAATHLNEVNPFLLPGVRIHTTPNDYYPMDKVKLARYRGTHWQFFGKLVSAQG